VSLTSHLGINDYLLKVWISIEITGCEKIGLKGTNELIRYAIAHDLTEQ